MKSIKHVIVVLALACTIVAAVPAGASAWTCHAGSPTGSWGWGSGSSVETARRRALYECGIRTPRGYSCRITRCGR